MKKKVKKTIAPEPIEDKSTLSYEQKNSLLVDLYSSKHWEALKILIDNGISQAEHSLFSLDTFKNPTETGRAQGIRTGLLSIEEYIKEIILRRKKREKELDTGVSEDDSMPIY